jgi:hypothetical protein
VTINDARRMSRYFQSNRHVTFLCLDVGLPLGVAKATGLEFVKERLREVSDIPIPAYPCLYPCSQQEPNLQRQGEVRIFNYSASFQNLA